MDKKKVEAEAKDILNKFSKELEKIKNLKEEGLIIRKESFREEKNGEECFSEKEFKKRILNNSKNKNKDAGTQISPVPKKGIKAKKAINKPQNKGEEIPKIKNPKAPKIP